MVGITRVGFVAGVGTGVGVLLGVSSGVSVFVGEAVGGIEVNVDGIFVSVWGKGVVVDCLCVQPTTRAERVMMEMINTECRH